MGLAKKVVMQLNLIDDAGLVDICYEPSCVVSLSLEALNKKYNDEIEKNAKLDSKYEILNTNYNDLIIKYETLNNNFNTQITKHNEKINEYNEKIKNFIDLTNKFSDVLKCLNN